MRVECQAKGPEASGAQVDPDHRAAHVSTQVAPTTPSTHTFGSIDIAKSFNKYSIFQLNTINDTYK